MQHILKHVDIVREKETKVIPKFIINKHFNILLLALKNLQPQLSSNYKSELPIYIFKHFSGPSEHRVLVFNIGKSCATAAALAIMLAYKPQHRCKYFFLILNMLFIYMKSQEFIYSFMFIYTVCMQCF